MPDLLESSGIDLRIVAGETVALLFELGNEEDEVDRDSGLNLYQKTFDQSEINCR